MPDAGAADVLPSPRLWPAPHPMTILRPILAALLLAAACSTPVAQQQANLCPAAPCAPGAASLGAPCGPALDGVCSAAGTCLPPCAHAADCAALAPGAGPGEVAACDAVSAACTYVEAPKPQGAGL